MGEREGGRERERVGGGKEKERGKEPVCGSAKWTRDECVIGPPAHRGTARGKGGWLKMLVLREAGDVETTEGRREERKYSSRQQ